MMKNGTKKTFKMRHGISGGKVNGKWTTKEEVLREMEKAIAEGWKVKRK